MVGHTSNTYGKLGRITLSDKGTLPTRERALTSLIFRWKKKCFGIIHLSLRLMPLPIACEIDRLGALQGQPCNPLDLIAIRDAPVIFPP